MKAIEILAGVRKLVGFKVTGTTLRSWASVGLIPSPTGGRRYAVWPEWTLAEVAACAFLMRRVGWSSEMIRSCRASLGAELESGRSILLALEKFRENPQLEAVLFQWVFSIFKGHVGKPIDQPLSIREIDNDGVVSYGIALPPGKYPHSPKLFDPSVKWFGGIDLFLARGRKLAGPCPVRTVRV